MSDRDILDRERQEAAQLLQATEGGGEAALRLLRERKEDWLRAQAELLEVVDGPEVRELIGRGIVDRSLGS